MRGVTVVLPARLSTGRTSSARCAPWALEARGPADDAVALAGGPRRPGPLADQLHAAVREADAGDAVRLFGATDAMPEVLAAADAGAAPLALRGDAQRGAGGARLRDAHRPCRRRPTVMRSCVLATTAWCSRGRSREAVAAGLARGWRRRAREARRAMGRKGRAKVLEAFTLRKRMVERTLRYTSDAPWRGSAARSGAAQEPDEAAAKQATGRSQEVLGGGAAG